MQIVHVVFIMLSVISVNMLKCNLSLRNILFASEICLPSWQDLHLTMSVSVMNLPKSYFHAFFFQLPASYLGTFACYYL